MPAIEIAQESDTGVWVKAFLLMILVSGGLQIGIATLPSFGDAGIFSLWMKALSEDGLAGAYWEKPIASKDNDSAYYPIDYPPVYPYILYFEATVLKHFDPGAFHEVPRLKFFSKLAPITANLILCLLIFVGVRRLQTSREAFWASAVYGLSPPILFNTSFWGQSDSVCALFLLLSFFFLLRKSAALFSIFLTLAIFTKPITYPFLPLILIAAIKELNARQFLLSVGVGLLTALCVFLPFLQIGRFLDITNSLVIQIHAAPYASVNAHNLWWLATGGLPWTRATTPIFGLLSYRTIGIALFGAFCILTLVRYWRSDNPVALHFAAASIAFGFFILLPYMHSYHLTYFLALAPPVLFWNNRFIAFYIFLTILSLGNMLLYDFFFVYLSNTGLILSMLISQMLVILFLFWIYSFYFSDNFDETIAGNYKQLPSLRAGVAAILLFLVITTIPFYKKAAAASTEHYLMHNFASTEKSTPLQNGIASFIVNIENDIRPVIYEHPPAKITYKLKLPDHPLLEFGIYMDPAVWTPDKGDGVLFELKIRSAGGTKILFSRYIDPKNNLEERKWLDEVVDLSAYSQETVELSFITQPGPLNDTRFDWAGWSDPRIIAR